MIELYRRLLETLSSNEVKKLKISKAIVYKKPNITAKEMQSLVNDVLKKEMKRGRIFRRLAVRQIPRLKRWKK